MQVHERVNTQACSAAELILMSGQTRPSGTSGRRVKDRHFQWSGMQRRLGGAAVSVVASNYLDKAIGPRFKSVSGLLFLFLLPTAIFPKLNFFPGRAHSSLFGTRCTLERSAAVPCDPPCTDYCTKRISLFAMTSCPHCWALHWEHFVVLLPKL